MKIEELTKTQYDILIKMSSDWCYPFSHFDELNLTRKELSKEFKILRESGLVEFCRGLMTEDGEVAGSGYGMDSVEEIDRLLEKYEEAMKVRRTNE